MAEQIGTNDNKRKHEEELLDNQNEKNLELEESYVTMIDILKEEEMLEEDAYAVLAGSDDQNCTFEQGYINRQALYACKTCMTNNSEGDIFGYCLACSYECHADHEQFELYTKRSFRCDCGTKKMKNGKCTLNSTGKDVVNEQNKYNHNFFGKYCLCDEPYPDTNGAEVEMMIQCIICEDWFHENCLQCTFPKAEEFGEMICKTCMNNNNQFLFYYQMEKVESIKKEDDNSVEIDVEHVEIKNDAESIKKDDIDCINQTNDNAASEKKESETVLNVTNQTNDNLESDKTEGEKVPNSDKTIETVTSTVFKATEKSTNEPIEIENSDHNQSNGDAIKNNCKLEVLKNLKGSIEDKKIDTIFFDEKWRLQLCQCEDCLKMYAKNKIEFLLSEKDTVHYYEAKGKEKCQKISQYERGLSEISKMDHVTGIEAIMGKFKLKASSISNKLIKLIEFSSRIQQYVRRI